MSIIFNIVATLGTLTQYLLEYFVKANKFKKRLGVGILILTAIGIWGDYYTQQKDSKDLSQALDDIKNSNKILQTQNDSLTTLISEIKTQQTVFNLLGKQSLEQNKKLLALTQAPVLIIQPENRVKGSVGNFNLYLVNTGVAELTDVEIYEDYFVVQQAPNGLLVFNRFGILTTKPNTKIQNIREGERNLFKIHFTDIYKSMVEHFRVGGDGMCIVRLFIKYHRAVDGRSFFRSKIYVIPAGGDLLTDFETRGIGVPFDIIDAVKRALGAE